MFSIWTKTPHHLCCKFTWQLPPRLIWKLTVPLKPFERVSIVDIADFSYGAFNFLNSSLSYYLSSLCVSFNIFCSRVLEKDARATQVIVLKHSRVLFHPFGNRLPILSPPRAYLHILSPCTLAGGSNHMAELSVDYQPVSYITHISDKAGYSSLV